MNLNWSITFSRPALGTYIQATAIILFLGNAGCQSVRSALKAMQDQQWEKAQATLEGQLADPKDSLHADTYYVYSLLYSNSLFTNYSVDSAYQYMLRASKDYRITPIKEKEKLARALPLTDSLLLRQKRRLDSLGFAEANAESTVTAYQSFLEQHSDAPQREEAVRLRNQLAFVATQQLDTYQAYQEFMKTYPEAEQYSQAEERFNTLAFQAQTKTGNLASYYQFLEAFPQSPYRPQAEQSVFSITTAGNDLASYANFARNFPQSKLTQKAVNWLYHLHRETHSADSFFIAFPDLPFLDSLKQAEKIASKLLLPYLNNEFGFIDTLGQTVIAPRFASVPSAYLCNGVQTPIILGVSDSMLHLLTKDGKVLLSLETEDDIEAVHELGSGLLWMKMGDSGLLFHASGEVVIPYSENTTEVELLPGTNLPHQFIKYQVSGQWGLKTLTGTILLSPAYDDITEYGEFVVLEKGGKLAVTNRTTLIEQAEDPIFSAEFRYEDVALLDQNYLLAYDGEYEMVLDTLLAEVVPLKKHTVLHRTSISNKDAFLLRTSEEKARVVNDSLIAERTFTYSLHPPGSSGLPNTFSQAYYNDQWLALKHNQQYWLLSRDSAQFSSETYDSVKILSDQFAFTFPKESKPTDSITLLIANHQTVLIPPSVANSGEVTFRLLRTQGVSTTGSIEESIVISQPKKPTLLLTQRGDTVLSADIDRVLAYPEGIYVIEQKGKQGVIDQKGNELVPTRYQRIGNYQPEGLLSLFNQKKFGVYHPRTGVIIEPTYESILKYYSVVIQDSIPTPLYVAQRDGKFGIVDPEKQLLLPFAFQAVRYWNDSSALVQYEDQWHIYALAESPQPRLSFDEQAIQYSDITEFSELPTTSSEKLLKIYKKGGYGILSNQRGEILPASFDDIRLLAHSQTQEPVYLTEKYVAEAKLHILIYMNAQGDIIFRKAYEPDAYNRIYCEE
ncbi:MAG: WG repeat-containing protein [Tunicatimonas sp.]|uniref:WG repeat-containing protein n=1 Tax=Tunicatimonas sp. TaxID=1940096 RepID=UPI003C74B0D4